MLLIAIVFNVNYKGAFSFIENTIGVFDKASRSLLSVVGIDFVNDFKVSVVKGALGQYNTGIILGDGSPYIIDVALYLEEKLLPYGLIDSDNFDYYFSVSPYLYNLKVGIEFSYKGGLSYFMLSPYFNYTHVTTNNAMRFSLEIIPKKDSSSSFVYEYYYIPENNRVGYAIVDYPSNLCAYCGDLLPMSLYSIYDIDYSSIADPDAFNSEIWEDMYSAEIGDKYKYRRTYIEAYEKTERKINEAFSIIYELNGVSHKQ